MGVKNQSNKVLQAEEQDKLTYVLDVIHNRFRYISNITELEKNTGVCSKESTRLFRKYLKMTPMEYIRQYRVTAACQLLKNTNLSVTEVSEQCGMNVSYLSKKVREMTGFTPLEYRRDHLRKQAK